MRHLRRLALAVVVAATLGAGTASAQVFGTFQWQLQPFCNVVTLTITQIPSGFTVDGTDNLCGVGGQLAGATGMAHINPDGTVGFEFTIVTLPLARPVHVYASVNPATGSGGWNDSAGNTGIFALGLPGTAGSPRPAVTVGLQRTVVSNTLLVPAGNVNIQDGTLASPACPAGTTLVGGGAGWGAGSWIDLYLVSSQPSGAGWRGSYRSERNGTATFEVFAICLR